MANDIFVCTITGRLGQDPDIRFTKSGKAVANFSVAVGKSWKDESGDWQEKTTWLRIVAWGYLAERMGERLSKGSQVAITGSLAVNEWEDKEGNKRQTPEVVASQIVMLGGNQTGSTSDEDAPEDDEDIPW